MPLQQTSGNSTQDAYGGGVAVEPVYIESIFSTYLYTGNGSTQTITNGIDLAGKGGLVWIKARNQAYPHRLLDTDRNALGNRLSSDDTAAQVVNTPSTNLATPLSTGFALGTSSAGQEINNTNTNFVSWTFRKQPKFFDVVTYTGTGSNTTISHNLGSVPGCIIVKRTDTAADWAVYHRSLANTQYLVLNTTAAAATGATWWNSTTPTSSVFSVGTDASVNASGGTYVAYVYAHNAGGFGLTGTDNVISCGSFTTDGSGSGSVTLGYEPQWWLVKELPGSWQIFDTMRGNSLTSTSVLFPDTASSEGNYAGGYAPTNATGFSFSGYFSASSTVIYIAIRRGPMKVPTDATTVFKPLTYTGNGSTQSITGVGFPPSAVLVADRNGGTDPVFIDKLRGIGLMLRTPQTFAEYNNANSLTSFNQNGVSYSYLGYVNGDTVPYVNYMFQRAPSFFDEVCYTGTGSATTFSHNLGVVPELIIVKRRDTTGAWDSYSSALANTEYVVLNTTAAKATGATRWNSTTPTSSVFSVGTSTTTNASAGTYVAYLFATCAGVSKCTAFTGTGTLQTINCGFTSGSRFVLIKRTDSTGDWYVWDSSRGLSSSTDPYLLLNSTAAEGTSTNWVDTTSTGFQVTADSGNYVNISGASYIALAIA